MEIDNAVPYAPVLRPVEIPMTSVALSSRLPMGAPVPWRGWLPVDGTAVVVQDAEHDLGVLVERSGAVTEARMSPRGAALMTGFSAAASLMPLLRRAGLSFDHSEIDRVMWDGVAELLHPPAQVPGHAFPERIARLQSHTVMRLLALGYRARTASEPEVKAQELEARIRRAAERLGSNVDHTVLVAAAYYAAVMLAKPDRGAPTDYGEVICVIEARGRTPRRGVPRAVRREVARLRASGRARWLVVVRRADGFKAVVPNAGLQVPPPEARWFSTLLDVVGRGLPPGTVPPVPAEPPRQTLGDNLIVVRQETRFGADDGVVVDEWAGYRVLDFGARVDVKFPSSRLVELERLTRAQVQAVRAAVRDAAESREDDAEETLINRLEEVRQGAID